MSGKTILLISILALGACLRLWQIDNNPPHLTPDEAALGYNAYSILQTGKDEYGVRLPLIFKSFGDYKPGLYIYSSIPFIWLFGLTEVAVRLPSALSGITAIYLLYLVVGKFFKNEKLSLISAFLLAINPWSIHFSRSAWEVNLALSLSLAAIYFFLRALEKQNYLFLSAFFFGLSLLAYQGAKLSSGLIFIILFVVYFRKILKIKPKIILGSAALGLVLILPVILSFISGKTGRLAVFSVFSYPRPDDYLQAFLNQAEVNKNSPVYYLFYSEPLNFLRGILGRYFNHFSTRFLFFVGDWQNVRHTPPYHGTMLLSDLLFIGLGLFAVLRKKFKPEHWFVLLWLFLSPLPAVLSRDEIHAVRSLQMLLPLVIIASLGVNYVLSHFRKLGLFVVVLLYLVSFIYFVDSEYVHLPEAQSKAWEYGYKQIVETVSPIQSDYAEIVVQQSYAQPYIYFLFFQKYPPQKLQSQHNFVENKYGDVGQVFALDNIKFEPIDWSVRRGQKGKLIVGDPIRIPTEDINSEEHRIISEIKYLDGSDAFRIIEIKNE